MSENPALSVDLKFYKHTSSYAKLAASVLADCYTHPKFWLIFWLAVCSSHVDARLQKIAYFEQTLVLQNAFMTRKNWKLVKKGFRLLAGLRCRFRPQPWPGRARVPEPRRPQQLHDDVVLQERFADAAR